MKGIFKFKKFLAMTLIAATSAVMAYSVTTQASPERCQQGAMADMKHGLPPFLRSLDLSSSQKDNINTLMEAEKSSMEGEWKTRHQLIQTMLETASKQNPDENKTHEIAAQLGKLEEQSWMHRANVGKQINALLTPEQRSKMLDDMKKHLAENNHDHP